MASKPLPDPLARRLSLEWDKPERSAQFIAGTFPYIYLKLTDAETLRQLRKDLASGFSELTDAATEP